MDLRRTLKSSQKRKRIVREDDEESVKYGIIIKYFDSKGYGFISDGRPWLKDVFFHITEFQSQYQDECPIVGTKVMYCLKRESGSFVGKRVMVLEEVSI